MIPVYVIVPRNYEYDDNYYNLEGYEGPCGGFLSLAEAEKERQKLEAESFAQIRRFWEYSQEGLEGLTSRSQEELVRELAALGFDPETDFARLDFGPAGPFVADPPANLMEKLTGLFDRLRFYEIVEIQVAASHHDLALAARGEK